MCDLYITTYDRGAHWQTGKPKAYHWAFLLKLPGSQRGTKHQLRGMPGAYYYPGPEADGEDQAGEVPNVDTDGASAQTMVTRLEIGNVSSEAMGMFEDVCRAADIEMSEERGGERKWNCQSWCLAVLEQAKRAEGIDVWYNSEEIREWLKEKS